MIKKLQIKFIAIVMSFVIIVLGVIFGTINFSVYKSSQQQTERVLMTLIENDGIFKVIPPPSADRQPPAKDFPHFQDMWRASRVFFVKLDANGELLTMNIDHIPDITVDIALEYARSAFSDNRDGGTIGTYQYLMSEKEYGYIVAFAERGIENSMLSQLAIISLLISVSCVVIIFIAVIFLSIWVVKPVKTAFEKQKQFISDAGHELKTPLTVISANVDVIETNEQNSKWLTYIKEQVSRMNMLIKDLLTLAKADENDFTPVMTEFDISHAAMKAILPFESIAFEADKELYAAIEPSLFYKGNEEEIIRLFTILADNAIKHSVERGRIDIKLYSSGQKLLFEVRNTGGSIDENDMNRIFERFYRSDASRSRETGGFGLGLAIAKAVADRHKAKISVTCKKNEWTCFTVIF